MAPSQAPLQTAGILPANTQPHPGLLWGANPDLPAPRLARRVFSYLLRGRHDASTEHTKTITASEVSKDKDEGGAQGLGDTVEDISRK